MISAEKWAAAAAEADADVGAVRFEVIALEEDLVIVAARDSRTGEIFFGFDGSAVAG